jgi:FAD/FMN-containing dehydrogenase
MADADIGAAIGRRRFLGGAGALAATALLGIPAQARAPETGDKAWQALRERLSGALLRPGDRGYDALSRPNNLRYAATRPAGIARCRSVEDVRAAILWARETGVQPVVRSGGHSYAGFSQTDGLLLDVSPMSAITLDSGSGVATVAGGARNAHVYAALRTAGVAITHGRCMGVGAAAFLLGGGVGFNMRAHGMGCDLMVGTEMVTAAGEVVTADARRNEDLFWASRGIGGGNLGVHTAFKLKTFEVRELCIFRIDWSAQSGSVAAALLEALAKAPDRLGSKITILASAPERAGEGARLAVNLLGQLDGPEDELRDLLAPVYRVAAPAQETVEVKPYWEAQVRLSEDGSDGRYQERSRYMAHAEALGALPDLLERLVGFPGLSVPAEAKFFQTGGAINRLAPDETAFVHRRNDWLFTLEIGWGQAEDAIAVERALAWQAGIYGAVSRRATGGAYQNFVDPSLEAAGDAYYGANLPRLRAVKAKYDPDNLFRFAQSVTTA